MKTSFRLGTLVIILFFALGVVVAAPTIIQNTVLKASASGPSVVSFNSCFASASCLNGTTLSTGQYLVIMSLSTGNNSFANCGGTQSPCSVNDSLHTQWYGPVDFHYQFGPTATPECYAANGNGQVCYIFGKATASGSDTIDLWGGSVNTTAVGFYVWV